MNCQYEWILSIYFVWYLYTFSKNDVISSVQKRYCALALGLELRLGLAEIRFQSNVFSSKCSRSVLSHSRTKYFNRTFFTICTKIPQRYKLPHSWFQLRHAPIGTSYMSCDVTCSLLRYASMVLYVYHLEDYCYSRILSVI